METDLQSAWAERAQLRKRGANLREEGDALLLEAIRLWGDAVFQACDDTTMLWHWRKDQNDFACELGTGEVFEPLS